jgi:uncharacterized membrane protein
MAKIERSIVINTSWQNVDAVALDGNRIPEWFSGVEKSEPDSIYPQIGGKVKLLYKAGPMSFDLTQTVLEYVPGSYILFRIEGGVIKGTSRWSHSPEGNGTRLANILDYETQGGGLGAIADKILLERMNTDQMEKSLARLKQLVEG